MALLLFFIYLGNRAGSTGRGRSERANGDARAPAARLGAARGASGGAVRVRVRGTGAARRAAARGPAAAPAPPAAAHARAEDSAAALLDASKLLPRGCGFCDIKHLRWLRRYIPFSFLNTVRESAYRTL